MKVLTSLFGIPALAEGQFMAAWLIIATVAASSVPAWGQETSPGGLEIDLEALEGLNPARDEGAKPRQAPPLPPAASEPPQGGPPAVNAAAPASPGADPQSPAAPRPVIMSTAPAGAKATDALRDLIIAVEFEPGIKTLSLKGTQKLDQVVTLSSDKGVRLQLFAYAGEGASESAESKRMALARAISVRGYLMGKGIDGSRIDLRPQGPAEAEPKERVDIIFLPQ